MRKASLFAVLAFLIPAAALAQPEPPRVAPPAGSATAPVEIPPPPSVNDPMLTPVPPAARLIANWEEALSLVRSRSTDLRIAVLEVARAEAQTRTALAGALTQINGNVTVTHNFITSTTAATPSQDTQTAVVDAAGTPVTPPQFVPFRIPGSPAFTLPKENFATAAITLVQPIFNLATWDQIGIARMNEQVSRLSVEDLKRNLALGVANAIVGVVTAERIAELNRSGFRNALERHDLTARKKALGAANGLDVVRAQQDVESARATLVTGDESLRQSRESLGLALGLPEQVGVTRDINLDGLERSALRICQVAQSIDSRADIAAARQRLEVAKRNLHNVYLLFAPTVNLQSALATTSNIATPQTTWNIQGVLSIPIWDGGVKYGSLRNNRVLRDEAEQNLESLRRAAIVQIEQAHRGVSVAEQSRKVAADTRALAAETDRLTQVGYREGQGTSLELVIAAAALRQADIQLALRDFDVIRARILSVLALATCPW